jgi:hypothetical protein
MPSGVRNRWQTRPPRPTLAKGRSFANLLWAAGYGWQRGFTVADSLATTHALIESNAAGSFPGRGHWEGGALPPSDANYDAEQVGIGEIVKQEAEAASRFQFGNVSQIPSLFGNYFIAHAMTVMALFRPLAVSTLTTNMVLQRRLSPFGAANSGWSISSNAAGGYDASLSDGATEVRASSTTLQSTARTDLVIFRYDRTNLDLFVNGVREARVAGAIAVGNPNRSIRVGGSVAGSFFNLAITMGALWARSLSDGEIAQAYADPFMVFRWQPEHGAFAPSEVSLRQDVQPGQVLGAMGDVVFSDFAPSLAALGGCCNCSAPAAVSMF